MANWNQWDDVSARVDAAFKYGAEQWIAGNVTSFHCDVEDGRYESPIEAIFDAWWTALKASFYRQDVSLVRQTEVMVDGVMYRIDFTVALDAHPGMYGSHVLNDYPKIAIELDGHEFHERTKEQVTYRNQRDRALQSAGWKVLHVSGSELYRDPVNCVFSVMEMVSRAFGDFWSEYWKQLNQAQAAQRAAAHEVGAPTSQES